MGDPWGIPMDFLWASLESLRDFQMGFQNFTEEILEKTIGRLRQVTARLTQVNPASLKFLEISTCFYTPDLTHPPVFTPPTWDFHLFLHPTNYWFFTAFSDFHLFLHPRLRISTCFYTPDLSHPPVFTPQSTSFYTPESKFIEISTCFYTPNHQH